MRDPQELADFVRKEALNDPRLRELIDEVRLYDDLLDHVGWKRLRERVAQQKDRFMDNIANRLMAGGEVSQREIDYRRGFFDGAQRIIEQPEVSFINLESQANRAYLEAELRVNSQEELEHAERQ